MNRNMKDAWIICGQVIDHPKIVPTKAAEFEILPFLKEFSKKVFKKEKVQENEKYKKWTEDDANYLLIVLTAVMIF